MMNLDREFERGLPAILLLVALQACQVDDATNPVSANALLRIDAASPVDFNGTVGELIDPVPTVVVRDERGKTVAKAKVLFRPVNRSSADAPPVLYATTDSRGIARSGSWRLGTLAGVQSLEARLVDEHYFQSDAGRVVTFRVDAKAAAPVALSAAAFSRDTLTLAGGELAAPIFTVVDRFNNGVAGVTVTFAVTDGGGSLEKSQVETSRWGTASPGAWALGPGPGLHAFVASAPGVQPLTFSARALDVGAVTWYDLEPKSLIFIERATIGLGQDGTFEIMSIESPDWFPELWPVRHRGKYTISGTGIELVFVSGAIEQGTVAGNKLSFVHKLPDAEGYPVVAWNFVKR
jgi:hypothetical protein